MDKLSSAPLELLCSGLDRLEVREIDFEEDGRLARGFLELLDGVLATLGITRGDVDGSVFIEEDLCRYSCQLVQVWHRRSYAPLQSPCRDRRCRR